MGSQAGSNGDLSDRHSANALALEYPLEAFTRVDSQCSAFAVHKTHGPASRVRVEHNPTSDRPNGRRKPQHESVATANGNWLVRRDPREPELANCDRLQKRDTRANFGCPGMESYPGSRPEGSIGGKVNPNERFEQRGSAPRVIEDDHRAPTDVAHIDPGEGQCGSHSCFRNRHRRSVLLNLFQSRM